MLVIFFSPLTDVGRKKITYKIWADFERTFHQRNIYIMSALIKLMEHLNLKKKDYENLRGEICEWLPSSFIDAHVHTATKIGVIEGCPKEAVVSYGLMSKTKLIAPLDVFSKVFPGKKAVFVGLPLPLPFKKTKQDYWNNVLMIQEMRKGIKGVMHCSSVLEMEKTLAIAKKNKVKFHGIKFHPRVLKDKARKDVFLSDLVNDELLGFAEKNRLSALLEMSKGFVKEEVEVLKRIDENFNINVVIPHMGFNYMGFTVSLKDYKESLAGKTEFFEKELKKLKNTEKIFFDTSTVVDRRIIGAGLRVFGEDRIIYGSDFPFGFTPKIKDYRPDSTTVVNAILKIMKNKSFEDRWKYDFNLYLMVKAVKDAGLEPELVMRKNAKRAYRF